MDFKFEMIPTVSVVFIALYLCISFVNIFFAFRENEKVRKATKPFCLITLTLAVLFWQSAAIFLIIGLVLDLIGDVLLIWKKKTKIFLIGSACFFLGHIFYTIQAFALFGSLLSWEFYVILCFSLLVFNLLGFRFTRRITKTNGLTILSNIYISSLLFTLIIFFAGCFVGYEAYLLIASLGMIAFVSSDFIILFTKFLRKVKRQEFFIMFLYLLAQFMIVMGFCMTFSVI